MSMSGTEASTVIQLIRNMRFLLSSTVRNSRSCGTNAAVSKRGLAVTMSCISLVLSRWLIYSVPCKRKCFWQGLRQATE